ncbi:class I SAM-dependent methyltransferase [Paraglaciecola aquimarina]|uniref:Class I SAM-dependent methyltransferase n=1 Tax=Paraglaciecola algarum TaxID=3050085 RepID=A0ABS9D257_9ALTE|nr:class I SAM-dependent methyltransferase [Paraglaciecola sp. G1-23]MCF2946825.1 class I SAM-dependent methyltransferase [Paraglaciecola sp. G1-23]
MKSALSKNSFTPPQSWQDLPLGEDVRRLIEIELSEVSRKFFGYHLVRLGQLSSQLKLENCPINHKINLTPQEQIGSGLVAKSTELPIAENSVDTFVLAHELDFSHDPHQVLREVDRTIMPNGNLVLTGFNPFSLCGMFKYLPFNKGNVLHDARFFSCTRVKDWLHLLGFEVVEIKHLLFNELFSRRRIHAPNKWNTWSIKHLGYFSSVYVIIAKKREIPLSIIKPKWKQSKPKFSTVNASARTGAMQNRQ